MHPLSADSKVTFSEEPSQLAKRPRPPELAHPPIHSFARPLMQFWGAVMSSHPAEVTSGPQSPGYL